MLAPALLARSPRPCRHC